MTSSTDGGGVADVVDTRVDQTIYDTKAYQCVTNAQRRAAALAADPLWIEDEPDTRFDVTISPEEQQALQYGTRAAEARYRRAVARDPELWADELPEPHRLSDRPRDGIPVTDFDNPPGF